MLIGEATVQCTTDCVSVSKGFIREHAQLYDELIRARAQLQQCRAQP